MDTTKRKIMIASDNNQSNYEHELLERYYTVLPCPTTSIVNIFENIESKLPDLILFDIETPEIDSFDMIAKLKSDERFVNIPVIFLTAYSDEVSELKGFELGVADYINKPFSPSLLLKRIEHQFYFTMQREMLQFSTDHMSIKMSEKICEVLNLQSVILNIVADLVEFRDRFTGGHIARTQLYMKAILGGLIENRLYSDEMIGWDLGSVLQSAQLHDVGKIAIPDAILNKPARLTPEEFTTMKTHVTIGIDAVNRIINQTKAHDFLRHTLHIIGSHHEKWDGTGYPYGLKGEEIPLEGRLMAVVDVYDALVSWRPYKEKITHERAKEIIVNSSGAHFDPALVNVFLLMEDRFRRVASRNEQDESTKWRMMTLTKDMELGVPEIDAQHKELIDNLNDFILLGVTSVSKKEIQDALDFLGAYIIRHFSDEEALQKQSSYPKYKWHKNQHQLLVSKYQILKQEFVDNGFSIELTLELGNSLVNWVVNHIKSVDVEFGKYYQICNTIREESVRHEYVGSVPFGEFDMHRATEMACPRSITK